MENKDQVFTIRCDEWSVMLDGKVLPYTWNSKGAAEAGLAVERRRAAENKKRDRI